MHPAMLKEIVRICRQRQREGDCPTAEPFSVEILEDAVIALADCLKIALDPDEEPHAGPELTAPPPLRGGC